MVDITLDSGDDLFLFERNGQNDTITDFKSIYFSSTLTEDQEVPPNADDPAIGGTGTGSLNFAQTQFKFSLDIDGINLAAGGAGQNDMTDMHIHGGAPGVSGGVIFAFRNDTVAAADDIETVIDTVAGTVTGGWDANEHGSGQNLTPPTSRPSSPAILISTSIPIATRQASFAGRSSNRTTVSTGST